MNNYTLTFIGSRKRFSRPKSYEEITVEANAQSEEEAKSYVEGKFGVVKWLKVTSVALPARMNDSEFHAKQDEILADIPDEFRTFLSHHAWEQSHSYGYEEVIVTLQDLVDGAREAIVKYTKRIKMEIAITLNKKG